MHPAAIHMLLQLPQIWLAGKIIARFFAMCPFSCLSTLPKTRQSVENTIFIVYANCLRVCCTGNQDILSPVLKD